MIGSSAKPLPPITVMRKSDIFFPLMTISTKGILHFAKAVQPVIRASLPITKAVLSRSLLGQKMATGCGRIFRKTGMRVKSIRGRRIICSLKKEKILKRDPMMGIK